MVLSSSVTPRSLLLDVLEGVLALPGDGAGVGRSSSALRSTLPVAAGLGEPAPYKVTSFDNRRRDGFPVGECK